MANPEVVTIPYAPRTLQAAIHSQLFSHRFGAVVCHRRFGKTVMAVNHLQRAAMENPRDRPRYAYIAPTYRQGKAVAWDYMQHYAAPVEDHEVNHSELRIDYLQNASQVRIYGADNPDALRGIYLDGVVFDEFGLMDGAVWTEVVRPLLADRGGWALFIGTPNGRNAFWRICQQAQTEPDWFFASYKASETGLIDRKELEAARRVMTADEYAQEWECSFDASVKGSVFSRELIAAREEGRITRVPYDPSLLVDTDWDLGVGDHTAIWFSQSLPSGEVRLIDYYQHSGAGLNHYRDILNQKGYTYGTHWAPHDIQVRELTSGVSRLEAARTLGIPFVAAPRVEHFEDGLHAARLLLPRCWFDAQKCAQGIDALASYRWDYNARIQEFTARPVHDVFSHAADAFRGLAWRHQTPKRPRADLALKQAQQDSDPFRWHDGSRRNRSGY